MAVRTNAQSGLFFAAAVVLWAAVFPVITFGDNCGVQLAIFDFSSASQDGCDLADAVRMKLSRVEDSWKVIDTQSMRELNIPTPKIDASSEELATLLKEHVGVEVCVFGSLTRQGEKYVADVRIFDSRDKNPQIRKYTFTDNTQRWRGVIAQKIVEVFTGKIAPLPPQYGDEPFPPADKLGAPINANSSFDAEKFAGWESPDNVACFIVSNPAGGKMLRIRTDLDRDEYLAYRKALLAGEASTESPPQIKSASDANSIAAQEGVHYKSDFIPANVNGIYWLCASCRFIPAKGFSVSATPKVFVKGFKVIPAAFDGLPESSLKKLKMTPAEFSALSPEKRRELIATDARENPKKYLRECYRWHLNCPASLAWKTYQGKFPPSGKLPADVQFLQIQIYSYWPAGEYFWDNVILLNHENAQEQKAVK